VLLLYGDELPRAEGHRARDDGSRIVDHEEDARRGASERFRAEVLVRGRLSETQNEASPTESCETTEGRSSVPATR